MDVFFVIYGYLIFRDPFGCGPCTFSFAKFYARRIKRIFPALLLVLIASYAFGCVRLLADDTGGLGSTSLRVRLRLQPRPVA